METRTLGRTGHSSSVAILGGAAFWNASPEQSAESFSAGIAAGVTHLAPAPPTLGWRGLSPLCGSPARRSRFTESRCDGDQGWSRATLGGPQQTRETLDQPFFTANRAEGDTR